MRPIILTLIAIALLPVATHAQGLPDAPAPAAPDSAWDRVRSLTSGQPVVVVVDYAPPFHCLFARATDAYLFCDPVGNPPGVGYRFDRATVVSVDLDVAPVARAQFSAPEQNWHPGLLLAAAIIGSAMGAGLTRKMNDRGAGFIGLLTAVFVETAGSQTLDMQNRRANVGFAYPLHGFAGVRSPRLRPHPRAIPRLVHGR